VWVGGRCATEEAALQLLAVSRAQAVNALNETLPGRLRTEMEARQAEACAAEAELLAEVERQQQHQQQQQVEEEEKEVAHRLAACRRDLVAFQDPLESTRDDAALAASVWSMLDGIRAVYARRIAELEGQLRLVQGAVTARKVRLGELRCRAEQAAVWRAYRVEERLDTVRENIMVQVDAYLDAFRPFAAWGRQRTALIAGLKGMMQQHDVLLDSRMALFGATRAHFEAVMMVTGAGPR
jgi:hypothetical protein